MSATFDVVVIGGGPVGEKPPRLPDAVELPTEMAWRAGVAEGLRLAQYAIRKGV